MSLSSWVPSFSLFSKTETRIVTAPPVTPVTMANDNPLKAQIAELDKQQWRFIQYKAKVDALLNEIQVKNVTGARVDRTDFFKQPDAKQLAQKDSAIPLTKAELCKQILGVSESVKPLHTELQKLQSIAESSTDAEKKQQAVIQFSRKIEAISFEYVGLLNRIKNCLLTCRAGDKLAAFAMGGSLNPLAGLTQDLLDIEFSNQAAPILKELSNDLKQVDLNFSRAEDYAEKCLKKASAKDEMGIAPPFNIVDAIMEKLKGYKAQLNQCRENLTRKINQIKRPGNVSPQFSYPDYFKSNIGSASSSSSAPTMKEVKEVVDWLVSTPSVVIRKLMFEADSQTKTQYEALRKMDEKLSSCGNSEDEKDCVIQLCELNRDIVFTYWRLATNAYAIMEQCRKLDAVRGEAMRLLQLSELNSDVAALVDGLIYQNIANDIPILFAMIEEVKLNVAHAEQVAKDYGTPDRRLTVEAEPVFDEPLSLPAFNR